MTQQTWSMTREILANPLVLWGCWFYRRVVITAAVATLTLALFVALAVVKL